MHEQDMNDDDGLFEGRRLRDEGMERVMENTSKKWKDRFERAIVSLADAGIPFDAVDVRMICGDPPGHPNAFGAMMNSVIKRKLITRLKEVTVHSSRPPAHGRRLMLYIGNENPPHANA
jgi:hypothetical protein